MNADDNYTKEFTILTPDVAGVHRGTRFQGLLGINGHFDQPLAEHHEPSRSKSLCEAVGGTCHRPPAGIEPGTPCMTPIRLAIVALLP